MSSPAPTFWFPVKRYGWGWGLPVRWQGWVVLAAYLALAFAGIRYLDPLRGVAGLLIYLLVLTALLIAVVVAKGERPVGWRWGNQ
jgi:hypothetical protein